MEDELADIVFSKEPFRDPTLYTFEEFLVMWERLRPEEIEKSTAIRRANTKVAKEDADSQHNAQYGRFLPQATDVSSVVDSSAGVKNDLRQNSLILPLADTVSCVAIETL